MELAFVGPPGGYADRTLGAMKLTGYLSLGYTTITQDEDGPLFAMAKFYAASIIKIPKYRHRFHRCSGY